METKSIVEPGHGWASSQKKLVTLEDKKVFITDNDIQDAVGDFAREFCVKRNIEFPFTNATFNSTVSQVLSSYLTSINKIEEYSEFCSTGRSNDRQMKWDIMTISANTSFKLHAHPNIEIIYVMQGAIHELRYEVCNIIEILSFFSNLTLPCHS
jgi:hypothetical protein